MQLGAEGRRDETHDLRVESIDEYDTRTERGHQDVKPSEGLIAECTAAVEICKSLQRERNISMSVQSCVAHRAV